MNRAILFFTLMITGLAMGQNQENSDYKKLALDQLRGSLEKLEQMSNSVSEEDLNYVPKDGGWTILNCLEHLAFVEPRLGAKFRSLVNENNIDSSKDLSANDWIVIAKVTDRTKKVITPEPFRPQPEMKNKTKDYFLNQIRQDRADIMDFIEETDVNLRHLFAPYPYGEADLIQQALVIGSHMYRHTMQIEEIILELYPDRKETAKL